MNVSGREGKAGGRNPEMNDREKSHVVVVPAKPGNKGAEASAEATADLAEGRTATKRNPTEDNTCRTPSRGSVSDLRRVRHVASMAAWTPTLKVRTGCGNSARPGPCGGHLATGVPTAIIVRVGSHRSKDLLYRARLILHSHPPARPPFRMTRIAGSAISLQPLSVSSLCSSDDCHQLR